MDEDWVLPPVDRRPFKRGLGSGRRLGVLWPRASTPEFDVLDVAAHERAARAGEEAGIDFVLVPDGYHGGSGDVGLRSMLWAIPVILSTSSIGVYTSMRTTFLHPVQIARFGAHLDWLSGGRWGWSVVTGSGQADARLYGLDDCPDVVTRYAMAEESVATVVGIWAHGDRGVDIAGEFFRVHGKVKRPQVTQRPRPPLLGSGSSTVGRRFAASTLDGWITTSTDEEQLRAVVADIVDVRPERSAPLRVVQHVGLSTRTGSAAGVYLCSSDRDLVEHVRATRRTGLVSDMLVELDDWSSSTLDLLARAADELGSTSAPDSNAARRRTW